MALITIPTAAVMLNDGASYDHHEDGVKQRNKHRKLTETEGKVLAGAA